MWAIKYSYMPIEYYPLKVQVSHAILFDVSLPHDPSLNNPAIMIYVFHLDAMKIHIPVRIKKQKD